MDAEGAHRRRKKLKGGRVTIAAAAGFVESCLEIMNELDPPLADRREFYVAVEQARAALHRAMAILIDQEP